MVIKSVMYPLFSVITTGNSERRTITRFLRSEKVFLLSEYANINYSFPQAFGYGVLAAIKKAGKALAHKKIKDSVAFMQITSDILLRTPEVVRTRKINKRNHEGLIHIRRHFTLSGRIT